MVLSKLPTLYSRDSEGRIKQWSVTSYFAAELQGLNGEYIVEVSSGLLGGKLTNKATVIKSIKNAGKANEVKPKEQVILEAQSKWNKKKREGYKSLEDLEISATPNDDKTFTIKEVSDVFTLKEALDKTLDIFNSDANGNLKPMLCQKYIDLKTGKVKIKFPCYGQPKINGVRCFIQWKDGKVLITSKLGLEYTILEHISELFSEVDFIYTLPDGTNISLVYDGELYIPNTILSDIVSAVRTRSLLTSNVKFYCFDLAVDNLNQSRRLAILNEKLNNHNLTTASIRIVNTVTVTSNEDALEKRDRWIREGYEGGIYRDFESNYAFGQRPKNIVKWKKRESNEFKIVDIIDSEDNPGIAIFVCRNNINHETFKVNPEGTTDRKKEYFTNKRNYIGKMATVEYYERTAKPKELPFHAVLIAARDYE